MNLTSTTHSSSFAGVCCAFLFLFNLMLQVGAMATKRRDPRYDQLTPTFQTIKQRARAL